MGKHVKHWRELSRKSRRPFPVNTREVEPAVREVTQKAYRAHMLAKKRDKLKEALVEMRLHPKDFAHVAAGGSISHLQRLGSYGRNIVRTTKRDFRGIHKQQGVRKDTAFAAGTIAAGGQKYRTPQFQGVMKKDAARHKQARAMQYRYGGDLSTKIGAGVLAAGVAARGFKAYKNWRRKASARPKFRGYDIYPEHSYSAVGIQPYNQPYYPDEDTHRAGPPRHVRAHVGGLDVYEEFQLDGNTRRDLIECITRTPFE